MPKYQKRPVVIEARHLAIDATPPEAMEIYQWVEQNTLGSFEPMDVLEGRVPCPASGVSIDPRDGRMIISTLEGLHWVDLGDWIIRGVAGEFYPCKPRIFDASWRQVIELEDLPDDDRLALLRFTEPNFAVRDARQDSVIEFRRHFFDAALAIILAAPHSKSRAVALTELETAMMWAVKAFFGAPGERR